MVSLASRYSKFTAHLSMAVAVGYDGGAENGGGFGEGYFVAVEHLADGWVVLGDDVIDLEGGGEV